MITTQSRVTMKNRATRLMEQADILAGYSESQTELTRAYLTPQHRAAHDQLAKWMQSAGLDTWEDSAGNQWGRKPAADPHAPVLILGSHSDTVINAGKYDGNLGVLLAIETLALLREQVFPFHIDVVAFADEEGTRFDTTLIGSAAVAGCFQSGWLDVKDADGVTMAQAMREFGLDPDKAGSDARKPEDTLAYLEVHIEQGPVLEAENLPVGVVTGIAGAKRFQCQVRGEAGHAGTVPVSYRHDALCGAAEMISCIEAFAREHEIVATVGKCDVLPGAVNVIPDDVRFTIDIRSLSQSQLEQCTQQLFSRLENIAHQRQLELDYENLYQAPAVLCDETLQQQWASAVETVTRKPPRFLPSGAGHDALAMAELTSVGMLFVRCEKGISHHPAEQVTAEDVEVALACLAEMVTGFDAGH
ncbi:N-carbamoyl-L-amino acid hydrolase [Vibrio aerogenes CECT 7868]|uniref:N-carbamoyl-L-amino acid hydrolase n=1 Tax=Vibrio aerogenes CECT 7868 TaxID=1216006 RepID=A0A1M5Z4U2_9VIBR|nr:allantoate amidohydrolase [Vibrio aerogenes]SHI18903.1 N-carbamoyl-L-amino acid hydrolase [Vibrio aerogenes CECT 7868]